MRGWPDDIGKSKKYYELGIPENAGWWDGKYNKYYSLEEAEEIAMRVGPTGLGGWWDGEITEYYTPEEAQQTATRLGLRDADFNVAWDINDGTDASSMFLKLDLNAHDPCVDPLSAPAEWAWYLEEPPPALAEDAQEAPPPAIDAQLVGRTVWVLCTREEELPARPEHYSGDWWLGGKITKYYTPEEAQQTAMEDDLQDAHFNVEWEYSDDMADWAMSSWLDLDKYDPYVDPEREPAAGAWYLEEVCPAAPVEHRNKRARATDFNDEETDAAEQQTVKHPRSGSASGEAATPVEVEARPWSADDAQPAATVLAHAVD
jgi:hypothetical protein